MNKREYGANVLACRGEGVALDEARMQARWKLGQLLSKVERSQGKTSLTAFTKFQEAMRGTVLSDPF